MLQELPEQLQPHMLIDVLALAICHQMILGQTFSRTHAGHGCEDDAGRLHIAQVADGLLHVASHVHRRRFFVTRTLLTQLPLPPQTTHLEELRGAEVRASRMAGREDEWSPNARGRCAKVQEDGSTDDRPGR